MLSSAAIQQYVCPMSSKSAAKRKADAAVATHSSINDQISAFLKSGGEIQHIPNGVSGQTYGAARPQAGKAASR